LTVVNHPPMITLPSGCSAKADTAPLTPEPGSKERSTSPGAADELLLSAPMRSRRLTARKCVADDFDCFIHMTFPISHADWAAESPQKSCFGWEYSLKLDEKSVLRSPPMEAWVR